MTITFVEKYVEPTPHKLWAVEHRPKSLDEIVGNEMVVETLKSYLKTSMLPNLIFSGPHGCGKTTVAKLVTENYLGKYIKTCSMEVIGSIFRGKNVVTEKADKKKSTDKSSDGPNIVNFISKTVNLPANHCKVIIIYDFDCMTAEAQMALRRIIEIYSNKVRFIFVCNNLNNVIEAIQSRTLTLKFNSLTLEQIPQRLKEISAVVEVPLSDEIYHSIAMMSNGDLKQAINYLQVFSSCNDHSLTGFYNIFNIPSLSTVQKMIAACLEKKTQLAFQVLGQLLTNGYNASDILDIVIKVLSYSLDLNDHQRAGFIEETIQVIYINETCPSNTHLYRLIVKFISRT